MKVFQTNNSKLRKMWLSAEAIFHFATDDGAIYFWNGNDGVWNTLHKANAFVFNSSAPTNSEIAQNITPEQRNPLPPCKNGK